MTLPSVDPLQLDVIGRVALAMALGAVLGFEREVADKPAGLRTHMLVAGAAALLVALGDTVVEQLVPARHVAVMRTDPIRIIEAVVTGVSFLGAGTIIRGGSYRGVEGLTTAASILFASAVGICVALSQIVAAVGVTLLVLITLSGIGRLSRRIRSRNGSPES